MNSKEKQNILTFTKLETANDWNDLSIIKLVATNFLKTCLIDKSLQL